MLYGYCPRYNYLVIKCELIWTLLYEDFMLHCFIVLVNGLSDNSIETVYTNLAWRKYVWSVNYVSS
jgi:hypothetical protein